jgi:hypothetical protein
MTRSQLTELIRSDEARNLTQAEWDEINSLLEEPTMTPEERQKAREDLGLNTDPVPYNDPTKTPEENAEIQKMLDAVRERAEEDRRKATEERDAFKKMLKPQSRTIESRQKEAQKQQEELAKKMEKVQDRRLILNELPDSPAKQKMLEANTSAWDKLTQKAADWFNDKLFIQESFDESIAGGLGGGNMGQEDRMRHLLWTSKLGEEYGVLGAAAITTLKEAENLFLDPWKQLRFMGKEDSDTIRERQFDAIKETGRDFQTNMFALQNQPRDAEGNRRAFTPEEARAIATRLTVEESPLVGRGIASVPTEMPPATPEPSAPVIEEALPDIRLAPGDSGDLGRLSLPVGAPEPGSRHLEIKQRDARGTMYRKDI